MITKSTQITVVELGIDSHEMREIFLAKIYELSNPSSSVGGMEDDFLCKFLCFSLVIICIAN